MLVKQQKFATHHFLTFWLPRRLQSNLWFKERIPAFAAHCLGHVHQSHLTVDQDVHPGPQLRESCEIGIAMAIRNVSVEMT